MKVLLSGGGTGGHVYPAIAIANKIKEENPDASRENALVIEKTKKAGITVALAKREWGVTFG